MVSGTRESEQPSQTIEKRVSIYTLYVAGDQRACVQMRMKKVDLVLGGWAGPDKGWAG